jgi:hypothetical protein
MSFGPQVAEARGPLDRAVSFRSAFLRTSGAHVHAADRPQPLTPASTDVGNWHMAAQRCIAPGLPMFGAKRPRHRAMDLQPMTLRERRHLRYSWEISS